MGSTGHQSTTAVVGFIFATFFLNSFEVHANGVFGIRTLNKTRGYKHRGENKDIIICGFSDEAVNTSQQQEVECDAQKTFCFAAVAVDQVDNSFRLSVIRQGCWPNKPVTECGYDVCIIRTPIPTSGGRILPEFCCCRGLYCNLNLSYVPRALPSDNKTDSEILGNRAGIQGSRTSNTVVLGVISSVFAVAVVVGIILVSWRCVNQHKALKLHVHSRGIESGDEMFQGPILDLNNVTFADLIHQGHYSTVRKAVYDGCDVVVKAYPAHSHNHWQNERNIYFMVGTHPNIAKFLASFEAQTETGPEGVLVMEYYPNGSLLSYLKQNTVTWDQMCQLALTVANGLAYLHGEVDEYNTDQAKRPVIVHRDLNSRNVLVKLDGSCALADFGFAVHLIGKQGEPYPEVGTVRYMPPEMLGGAVNWHDESALKQADVYSLGLVIWEIARRCREPYGDSAVPDAKLPYEEELPCHPTPDMIHQLVVHEFLRPAFPEKWKTCHFAYQFLKDTIEECWDQEPEARLTALCVVRRMQEIIPIKQLGQPREQDSTLNNRNGFGTQYIPKEFVLKNIVSNNVGNRGCYEPLLNRETGDGRNALEPDKPILTKKLQCKRKPCAHDCCCIPSKLNRLAWFKDLNEGASKAHSSEMLSLYKSELGLREDDRPLTTPLYTDIGLLSSSLPHDLHKCSRHPLSNVNVPTRA